MSNISLIPQNIKKKIVNKIEKIDCMKMKKIQCIEKNKRKTEFSHFRARHLTNKDVSLSLCKVSIYFYFIF
jgi:hypothetical protein